MNTRIFRRLRILIPLAVLLTCASAPLWRAAASGSQDQEAAEAGARAALQAFHQTANAADVEGHLRTLAPGAVILGTDPEEVWNVATYARFLREYLHLGKGRMSKPTRIDLRVADCGQVAWFEERLDKPDFGWLRATGVLRLVRGEWKVAQIHIAIPVPNAMARDVVAKAQGG